MTITIFSLNIENCPRGQQANSMWVRRAKNCWLIQTMMRHKSLAPVTSMQHQWTQKMMLTWPCPIPTPTIFMTQTSHPVFQKVSPKTKPSKIIKKRRKTWRTNSKISRESNLTLDIRGCVCWSSWESICPSTGLYLSWLVWMGSNLQMRREIRIRIII